MTHMKLLTGAVLLLAQVAIAQPRNFPQPQPPKEVTIPAIPGVIAAGVQWKLVWQGPETADGIAGTNDGGLLFAQEQTNRINKLDKDDKFSVFLSSAHGPGAVSLGRKGQVYAVERSCTDPGGKPDQCKEPTDIALLTPIRKILANNIGGKSLGRVNDLTSGRKGDVYFTSGGAFHLSPDGKVESIGENLGTNGIILSPDEKTLYITNGRVIAAFDVQSDGSVKNQREFGKLEGGGAGDGMAVDAAGRLYVTAGSGIQVLAPDGKYLGMIPTPRAAISVAFSGPGKKMLYVACLGAVGADGQEIRTAPGVRNTAMTVYKVVTEAQGYKGRPK